MIQLIINKPSVVYLSPATLTTYALNRRTDIEYILLSRHVKTNAHYRQNELNIFFFISIFILLINSLNN